MRLFCPRIEVGRLFDRGPLRDCGTWSKAIAMDELPVKVMAKVHAVVSLLAARLPILRRRVG